MDKLTTSEVADILTIGKLMDMVSEVLIHGFGEVNMKVVIKNKSISIISMTKTETINVDNLVEKGYTKSQ